MCTVTYFPISQEEFILTSNRDELPGRITLPPKIYSHYKQSLVYPKDERAGGTWIAASDKGTLVCLLNGGEFTHLHSPPYRKSRGQVVLDFFSYQETSRFFDEYFFEGIEPFTLLVVEGKNLFEFRWNAPSSSLIKLNANLPHLWSSSTLYPKNIQKKRTEWFSQWQENSSDITPDSMVNFHEAAGDGNIAYSLIMQRPNGIKTVSISQFHFKNSSYSIQYKVIETNQVFNETIFCKNLNHQ